MSGPQYYASSGLPPPQGQGQSYGDPLGKNSAFIPPSAPSTLATQVDSQVGSIYSGEPQKDVPMPPESASPSPPGYQAPPQYAQQGPPPQGYPPQGYPPQGYPPGPQGYAQGPPPQGYAQGPPPQGYAPQGYPPPQGFVQGPPPQGYPPQGYPQGYPQGPPAYGPQGGAPLPSSPQPYPGGPPPNGNWATPAPGAPGAPGAVPAGDPTQAFSETTQWAQNLAPMPSNDQVSTAKIETSHSGVESDDACLNDKDQALLFFTNYNTRPGLAIQVHGTHTEHYTTTSRDSKGHTHTHHHTRTVTDFRYGFNISNHVMEGGVFDARPKVGLYLASSNVLKRCRMIKKVNLDFESIRASIINRIRSLGYMHTIMVTPCYSNHMVVINNSDDCSKCLRSGYTTCLCWLTCACIVWYPIKWFMQGRSDGDQDFESVFQFDSSTEMLLQRILPCCGAWGTYYSMTI